MILAIGAGMLATMLIVGRKAFSKQKEKPKQRESIKPLSIPVRRKAVKPLNKEPPKEEKGVFPIAKSIRRQQQYVLRNRALMKKENSKLIDDQTELELKKLIANANIEHGTVLYNKTMLEQSKANLLHDKVGVYADSQMNALNSKKNELDSQGLDMRFYELDLTTREKNLLLDEKGLNLLFQEKELEMNVVAHDLKVIQDGIMIAEKRLENNRVEALNRIKEEQLNNYSQYLNQMIDIKVEKARLMDRENKVNFKEKYIELNNLYQRTLLAMDKLRWIPGRESAVSTHRRQEAYFKQFMDYHFEWIRM